MSTRGSFVVVDAESRKAYRAEWSKPLWFYRHSDGYPEGAMPLLAEFMERVSRGKIRDNADQAAGWLILMGHEEQARNAEAYPNREAYNACYAWKCGSIEPTCGRHGDIEYLYLLDLAARTVTCYKTAFDLDGEEAEDWLGRKATDIELFAWQPGQPKQWEREPATA